ncbi:hypothetical protein E3P81_01592 [Wallemia ichthyophaga]|nr:hypothetical protein E3P91_01284 [Wallemia ichthyophaga]TIA92289.1 hypothetical protein E3P97_01593 [Wallemia ichthyophaga]TIA96191.1 hypothetical protein E3P96_03668 [Wallemia ichthyophaga]TIB33694.1 hypothetical protein E3P85_01245 [Wallemia ichthyophaga]TIB47719.1 hypothetical protein E3P82_01591 [Wallemia ichthyophaga]
MSNTAITYTQYHDERQLASIMDLIDTELSEPYINMTYRYFVHTWPQLTFLAHDHTTAQSQTQSLAQNSALAVGVVVCKQERHKSGLMRGYIAMLSVRTDYRKRGIATKLVRMAIDAMISGGAEEIVLETEVDNSTSIAFYKRLGFMAEKRLYRFYMNGKDAFRLCLPVVEGEDKYG